MATERAVLPGPRTLPLWLRKGLAKRRRMRQLRRLKRLEREERERYYSSQLVFQCAPPEKEVRFDPDVVLVEATARKDIEDVRHALNLGANVDATNEDELTPLHLSVINDDAATVLLLLESGASVDARDAEGWTPLHAAARCGHVDVSLLLLERGADLLAANEDGRLPHDLCLDFYTLRHYEGWLADRGVTQEMIDAARTFHEKQMLSDVKGLFERGGNVEFQDYQGVTAWEVVELLAAAGADLSSKTGDGKTPYDLCDDERLRDRIAQLQRDAEMERAKRDCNTRGMAYCRYEGKTSVEDKSLVSPLPDGLGTSELEKKPASSCGKDEPVKKELSRNKPKLRSCLKKRNEEVRGDKMAGIEARPASNHRGRERASRGGVPTASALLF